MKQRDLIKKLRDAGFEFERHGGNHDIYKRGKDEEKQEALKMKVTYPVIFTEVETNILIEVPDLGTAVGYYQVINPELLREGLKTF